MYSRLRREATVQNTRPLTCSREIASKSPLVQNNRTHNSAYMSVHASPGRFEPVNTNLFCEVGTPQKEPRF